MELSERPDSEVLVKVHAAGVCHSDWHIVSGATQHTLPVALGHEGAGVVADLSLDQVNDAYADMLSGTVARGVIVFD